MIYKNMIFLSLAMIAAFSCPGSSAGMIRRKRQGLINLMPPQLTRFISPLNPFRAVDVSNENGDEELEDVNEHMKEEEIYMEIDLSYSNEHSMSMTTPALLSVLDTTKTENIEWEPSVKPSASPTVGSDKFSSKMTTKFPSVAPSSGEWASASWEPSGSPKPYKSDGKGKTTAPSSAGKGKTVAPLSTGKGKTAAPSSEESGGSRRLNRHRG